MEKKTCKTIIVIGNAGDARRFAYRLEKAMAKSSISMTDMGVSAYIIVTADGQKCDILYGDGASSYIRNADGVVVTYNYLDDSFLQNVQKGLLGIVWKAPSRARVAIVGMGVDIASNKKKKHNRNVTAIIPHATHFDLPSPNLDEDAMKEGMKKIWGYLFN